MRQSQLFTKTRRESPKDEVSKNAQFLIRAGYIHKEMAGVYDFLPLGLRTLEKIVTIIREEMNGVGGIELHLSALQHPAPWQKSGRWSAEKVDSWFKTELRGGGELGLSFTHEEPLTVLLREYISSWRDLPIYPYQFQIKFRNEERAKSGLMRTREFLMKDLYSFSTTDAAHETFYKKITEAYTRVFSRVGLGEKTYFTFASGGSFSKYSHEFQTLCEAGEDTVFVDEKKLCAINKEVYDDPEVYTLSGLRKESLREAKAIEVGNIFTLGTKYSESLGLMYKDTEGKEKPVVMGSYGIGLGRLLAAIAEVLSDDRGLVWPESVAPFRVHLVEIPSENSEISDEALELYQELSEAGVEVLWDDRDLRAGEKFTDSDLIGIPLRIVVSEKAIGMGRFECVERRTGKVSTLSVSELIETLRHV